MALAKLGIDSNIFGVPAPPMFGDAQPQQQQQLQSPSSFSSFGDTAPLGGTPTVPPTAQPVAPSEIAQPQQNPLIYIPPGTTIDQNQSQQVDPSRYDPNLTYGDYSRDYWAPDRQQVLDNWFWQGAPANNPTAAPEQGYYGTNTGAHSDVYTAQQGNFDNYFQNYWAPDRAQVLASLRYGAGSPKLGSLSMPGNVPATPAANNPQAPWSQTPPPAGFDAGKWNDPQKHDPKYDVGHMVASGESNDQIEAYLKQFYPGWNVTGNDIITDPNNAQFDFRFDQEGANKPMWEQAGGGAAAPNVGPLASPPLQLPPNIQTLNTQSQPQSLSPQGFGGIAYHDPNAPIVLTDATTGQTTTIPPSGGAPMPTGGGTTAPAPIPAPAGGGTSPVVNVGSDALSQQINSALSGQLQSGSTPYGNQIAQQLLNILSGNGMSPDITRQLQTARTDAARAMNTQLSDADAALASRGLASTPGVAQGANIGATERVAQDVGANFASALRDVESHGLDLANATEVQALSLATGLSESQAQNILGAIGQGTNRQGTLANIALQQLSMNQDWNKFILGYGLDQQKLAEDISQGRIDNVIRLLDIYLRGAGTAAGGYY